MTAPMTPRLDPPKPEDIQASYGFVALLARSNAEIARLLEQATREQWTTDRFSMAITSTQWWRGQSDEQRKWTVQQIVDPKSAEVDRISGGNSIMQKVRNLGFTEGAFISAKETEELWLLSRINGWDEQQTMAHLVAKLAPRAQGRTDKVGGTYGQNLIAASEMASAYGYTPNDLGNQLNQAVWRAMEGGTTGTLAAWEQKLRGYAKSKYAAFADRIDQGETVRDIAQPYVDVYAQTLEVSAQDIGLDDKYIQKWLQGASEAGKPPAAVPVWQAQQELRKDERWGYTRNAHDAMGRAVTEVGRRMGFIG